MPPFLLCIENRHIRLQNQPIPAECVPVKSEHTEHTGPEAAPGQKERRV